MKKPINILIFEPYPYNSEGGNQRTLRYMLEFTDKSKFNLMLLSPVETDFIKRISNMGLECIVMKPPKKLLLYGGNALRDNIIGRFFTMIATVVYNLKLVSLIRRKEIDIIYSNCVRAVLSIGLAAKLCRKPHLWYIKGELGNKLLDVIGFVLADKILFFCESNKNDKYPFLVNWYKKKIGILKIGIDPETIIQIEKRDKTKLLKEILRSKNSINVIYLGQLYSPKGVHYLVEALGLLIKDFPNVMLYIVGDHVIDEYKSYKEELANIINKYKLENNVIFTGWRSDALEILSLMDVIVHPSLSEGFGRAVLEAMALRKPVVASKVGGLREIIRDGENGFLVEPKDHKAIAEKLYILLNNKTLRGKLGEAARKTVFSEYLIRDKIMQFEQTCIDMVSRG